MHVAADGCERVPGGADPADVERHPQLPGDLLGLGCGPDGAERVRPRHSVAVEEHLAVEHLSRARPISERVVDPGKEPERADDADHRRDRAGDRGPHRERALTLAPLEREARADRHGQRRNGPDPAYETRLTLGASSPSRSRPGGCGGGNQEREDDERQHTEREDQPVGVEARIGLEPARQPDREQGRQQQRE